MAPNIPMASTQLPMALRNFFISSLLKGSFPLSHTVLPQYTAGNLKVPGERDDGTTRVVAETRDGRIDTDRP
jgi:hypothetical protein